MVDQRDVFKQFYIKVCEIEKEKGKVIAKDIFDLVCNKTIVLIDFKENQHESYGRSIILSLYIHVIYQNTELHLPGNLLFSIEYFYRSKPILILKENEHLRLLNHAIIDNNSIVHTNFQKNWDKHPSLFDFISDAVTQLQGNPFNYKMNEAISGEKVEEPVAIDPTNELDEVIPYEELIRGEELGHGAFSKVYCAEWRGEKVAMKEITRILQDDVLRCLKREIAVQRSLNHPNCLHLYGISKNEKGYPVLVMELADCSLTDLTTKSAFEYKMAHKSMDGYVPKLSNEQKCEIIREIAEGLVYIHSKGFIHRDIKLDNILMKDGHPKIADFGLARYLEDQHMNITFAGTPCFMAPELINRSIVSNTVDCYSFGCIVTEILYEKPCFWDYHLRNGYFLQRDIVNGLRPTILENTPREVKYLIEECFKSKSFRPSMAYLLDLIKQWSPERWGNCFNQYAVC